MRAIYSEIVTLVIIPLVIRTATAARERTFSGFAQSENLFKEYYDSGENEQSYYLTCAQRKNRHSRLEGNRERVHCKKKNTNDEGACLESFYFSCVVSKLNVY